MLFEDERYGEALLLTPAGKKIDDGESSDLFILVYSFIHVKCFVAVHDLIGLLYFFTIKYN